MKKIRDPDPTRAGVGLWAVGILTSHPWSQEIPRIGSGCHVDLALCAFYFFFFFSLVDPSWRGACFSVLSPALVLVFSWMWVFTQRTQHVQNEDG